MLHGTLCYFLYEHLCNIHNKRDGLSFHLDMAATTVLNKNEISKKLSPRAAFVHKTLSEDYPGLDYLGMNSVLTAKHRWYIILWFTILFILLTGSIFTVYRFASF